MAKNSNTDYAIFHIIPLELIIGCVVARNIYHRIFGFISFFQPKEIFRQQKVVVTLILGVLKRDINFQLIM
jgi:hypothetical protein